MRSTAENQIKIISRKIMHTIFVENRLDYVFSLLAPDVYYLGSGKNMQAEGKKKFEGAKKFDINMFFHDYLMDFFENVVIPKKWRFLDALPSDLQGKHKKLEIQALFAKEE